MKFFKCYSINLYRFLKANGLNYLSRGTNEYTYRKYWVFLKDDKLCNLLKIWADTKEENLKVL